MYAVDRFASHAVKPYRRQAWRRLAKAEGEVSLLRQRSEGLEDLAKRCQASLEAERQGRRQDQKNHASELQRAAKEAATGTAIQDL